MSTMSELASLPLSLPQQLDTPSLGRIATLESLREHLQWAVELEHFTLPPYLCGLYSLDRDRNPDAAEVVASVLVEEMLHMTLAANLLNAVGGRPRLDTAQLLQGYPRPLPHSDGSFEVPLLGFCPEALEVYLKIEQPASPDAPAEGDRYETIGQFYDAIRRGFRQLCADLGEAAVFCGDPARQVTDELVYRGGSGGGNIITVRNLETALAALEEVVDQGEGAPLEVWDGDPDVFHPEREQVAHYFRFQELKLGRRYRRGDTPQSGPTGEALTVDWAGVLPMQANPRISDSAPGSPIRAAQEAFNRTYCDLLNQLEEAFNGSPELLGGAIGAMYGLKEQAEALMRMPTGDGRTTAGPTFENVAADQR